MSATAEKSHAEIDRRSLLKLVGASLSMAGLAACSPAQEIVPYVRQPEIVVPGKPLYYATTLSSRGYGLGAVVESQPFGGEGLSGTGPKAGGPHYVARFATERVTCVDTTAAGGNASLMAALEG